MTASGTGGFVLLAAVFVFVVVVIVGAVFVAVLS